MNSPVTIPARLLMLFFHNKTIEVSSAGNAVGLGTTDLVVRGDGCDFSIFMTATKQGPSYHGRKIELSQEMLENVFWDENKQQFLYLSPGPIGPA